MNKEKEIEEMEKAIISANARVWEDGGDCYHAGEYREPTARERAERLINAGYGNIEQAVKEFAEDLEKKFGARIDWLRERQRMFAEQRDYREAHCYMVARMELESSIDYFYELLKEKFGEVEG